MQIRQIQVTTWRDGLLARLGHDLDIQFGPAQVQWTVDANGMGTVLAAVPADAILDMSARKPSMFAKPLSESDRAEIVERIHRVLEVSKYKSLTLNAKGIPGAPPWPKRSLVPAEIQIAGRTGAVAVSVEIEGRRARCLFPLDMSRFALEPVTALMGAIKLKPIVDILVELDLEA